MVARFIHYISYGATDQQTVRHLAGQYDGILVPGTVAAFQRAGTGGFVLTLSATEASPRYMIDPRFPLFQQRLAIPKKSHEALASILGAPELVRDRDPVPGDFHDDLIGRVAAGWVAFNSGYTEEARKSFDKYAKRLGESVEPENRRSPHAILAPYLISSRSSADWWAVSQRLFDATVAAATSGNVMRVVAAEDPRLLAACLGEVADERVAIWSSGLNELQATEEDLVEYGVAIHEASARGTATFALYGGFFGVLLRTVGLGGSSHGIGYGESRAWIELPQSGPPPARYYLPRAHRYVSQDLAYQLWTRDSSLVGCACAVCKGGSPLGLGYQELMEHSVLCRASEIDDWTEATPGAASARLSEEYVAYLGDLRTLSVAPGVLSQVERSVAHLPVWIRALERLEDSVVSD